MTIYEVILTLMGCLLIGVAYISIDLRFRKRAKALENEEYRLSMIRKTIGIQMDRAGKGFLTFNDYQEALDGIARYSPVTVELELLVNGQSLKPTPM